MSAPVEFYFDFGSPYGYLASTQIDELAARYGRTVVWRPMMLGPAMKVTGGQPLVRIPLRREYTARDLPRFARYLGVPLTMPPSFPIVSLAAARACWWQHDRDPGLAKRLARALFAAHWGRGEDITLPEQVAEVAATLDIDREALLAAVRDPAVKERLKAETEAAIARGVFGSPFIFVDDEPFWGADRLDQVAWWLRGAADGAPPPA